MTRPCLGHDLALTLRKLYAEQHFGLGQAEQHFGLGPAKQYFGGLGPAEQHCPPYAHGQLYNYLLFKVGQIRNRFYNTVVSRKNAILVFHEK
jgi:hypothetical protein